MVSGRLVPRETTLKEYAFNGLAGCVEQKKARQTGTLVGVYHGEQAGMEADPEAPWLTVCEAHSTMVSNRTVALARASAATPAEWCEHCTPRGA